MKTIYLHIGTHKTATTAIQHFCKINKKALRDNTGYAYPLFPLFSYRGKLTERNGIFLTSEYYDETGKRREDIEQKRFREGLEDIHDRLTRCDAMVLSDEAMWRNFYDKPHLLEQLRDDARENGYRIHLIVYLRRQDQFIESMWHQRVKRDYRPVRGFKFYINHYKYLDYYEILTHLAGIIGKENMTVRRFYDGVNADGGIIGDFLRQIGIEMLDEYVIEEDLSNVSLFGNLTHIKREINRLGTMDTVDNDFLRDSLTACVPAEKEIYNCSEFSEDDRREFMHRFEEGNAAIAEEFIGDGRPLFSDDYAGPPKRDPENPYYIGDVIRAGAQADIMLARRLSEAEARADRLEQQLSDLQRLTNQLLKQADSNSRKIDHLRHPMKALRDRRSE